MAKQVVAGMEIRMSADAMRVLTELEKVRKETTKMRKTVESGAQRIGYAFNKIRRAAQVMASAFIVVAFVKRIGQMVTAMAKAEEKVQLMQARFQQFARAGDSFTRIYKLSKRLGTSLESTAEGMTRLLVATKGMGTAQPILEKVHENIVVLGRAGGTSAEEMKGAMRQLSQGLASGRLQGEELRSVLENLPLVAMEIAKELDIGVGQIRRFAKEGKITGQVVVDALDDVGVKLEDLPQTWSMQTENLRTEWDLFLADLSRAVDEAGLLRALTDAVKWVRINMFGSFLGVPTEELEADLDKAVRRLEEFRQKQSTAVDEWRVPLPPPRGDAAIEAMAAYNARGTGSKSYQADIQREIELIRSLNEELQRRRKLEKIAEDAANARQLLRDDAAAEELREKAEKRWRQLRETLGSELNQDLQKFRNLQLRLAKEVEEGLLTERQAALALDDAYQKLMQKYDDMVDKKTKADDALDEDTKKLDSAWKDLGMTFESAFENAIVEGEKLRDVLHGIAKDVLRIFVRTQITKPFIEALGARWPGIFGDPDARAMGGPVFGGQTFLVGENGPELFTPSRSGYIVPNHALSGAGGVNYTINIDSRSDRAQLMTEMTSIMERTVEMTEARLRRQKEMGRF